ncbi:MAG: WYL domain-containing protein [Flavobacteriaceae bacterium]|nr:WYL domain-containing protein [Flavobacteriaceae bacterium]
MSKREGIARYNLIINKLRKRPANFDEILDNLERESDLQGYDFIVSKRTFQRDLDDIRSLYNIDIQYDRSLKKYKIEDEDSDASHRVLEAFDTFNALNVSDRISDFIHFEKRKSKGTEHLYGILHAIKNQVLIKFQHQKFWEDEITERTLEPYALKEARNRWYLVGKDLKDNRIKNFALDRISNLEITKQKFTYPNDFNIAEYYKYSFGIKAWGNEKPQEIVLSFTEMQGKYIKTLPLHHSQEILKDNENEFKIRLKLNITYDFIMELLSFGKEVQVIKPKSLINKMKAIYEECLMKY